MFGFVLHALQKDDDNKAIYENDSTRVEINKGSLHSPPAALKTTLFGGDPAAGSPTATLLRLLPTCVPKDRRAP